MKNPFFDGPNNAISSLYDLYDAMSKASRAKDEAQVDKLYSEFYLPLIRQEGFSEAQASAISWEAYERGHSAGRLECVSLTPGIIEFAKKIRDNKAD